MASALYPLTPPITGTGCSVVVTQSSEHQTLRCTLCSSGRPVPAGWFSREVSKTAEEPAPPTVSNAPGSEASLLPLHCVTGPAVHVSEDCCL